MKFILLLSHVLCLSLSAAPTDERIWNSSAGTTLKASATDFQNGQVVFKTSSGRVIKVPLNKLSEDDQKFLKEHFDIKEAKLGEPTGSGRAFITEGLAHPIGQATGPIDAGDGSNYYVYIPKTLRVERKAPLIIYNSAGGGKERVVNRYAQGAELNG